MSNRHYIAKVNIQLSQALASKNVLYQHMVEDNAVYYLSPHQMRPSQRPMHALCPRCTGPTKSMLGALQLSALLNCLLHNKYQAYIFFQVHWANQVHCSICKISMPANSGVVLNRSKSKNHQCPATLKVHHKLDIKLLVCSFI